MKEILVVFFGSGLGGVLRFGLGRWISALHKHYFPFGTFIVNIIACFAVGLIIGLADHKQILSPQTRLFWTVGFCGGFSTFSAFSSETLALLQQGHYIGSALYILGSVFICVAATFGGLLIMQRI
ncbi:MAG: fluoride efflux transporter CrcB [Spirochaetes bacterium]|nr:fluoride efflux transporter CrcB [Spirochaetota bacterium]